jgi:hypothetical protein
VGECGLNLSGSGLDLSMADSCDHGNEPSGSTKGGKFLDYLSVLSHSQELS